MLKLFYFQDSQRWSQWCFTDYQDLYNHQLPRTLQSPAGDLRNNFFVKISALEFVVSTRCFIVRSKIFVSEIKTLVSIIIVSDIRIVSSLKLLKYSFIKFVRKICWLYFVTSASNISLVRDKHLYIFLYKNRDIKLVICPQIEAVLNIIYLM